MNRIFLQNVATKLGTRGDPKSVTLLAWAIALGLPILLGSCMTTSPPQSFSNALSIAVLTPVHREALTLIQKYQTSPLRAARMLAYLDSALLEANRSIAAANVTPIECQHLGYATAGYSLLANFFPLETPGRLISKPRLSASWNDARCDDAKRLAETSAQSTIARAMRDGANPPKTVRAQPERVVGQWEPTPPLFSANPTEPYAGEWIPMLSGNPSQLRLTPPLSPQSVEYQKQIDEVISVSANLTASQKHTAEKWNLAAGSVTPAGVWNTRLQEIVAEERLSDQRAIELFAAVHIAMHDALIACSYSKYLYWTERPITAALRQRKTNFKPVLVTPSFPAYPSGHACASAAAARVIASYLPSRSKEVTAMANEAAESRVLGGIHFRFDAEEGLEIGRQVGDKVLAHFAAKQ